MTQSKYASPNSKCYIKQQFFFKKIIVAFVCFTSSFRSINCQTQSINSTKCGAAPPAKSKYYSLKTKK